ncbi:transglutaminaseTgpA domain-containing protein [Streptomyces sp. LP05-1]|uniref:TransglutaminaseTgpA domain-containing protein n=1 Tax=Streptomyces pyxinae TaxID=2970734 RepID=A0ABT2CI53_9ACTN|nr:transglutaminaseTgpA domain-containing protein [Streptomyces sp. LP05-1]MCS0636391.1 transglutaminaseTgpA domain-containing protein [Streptomyces sp. LP05-1]
MSGRGRLALCAFAATLLASGALVPLVDPASWILQAGLLLGVQSLAGALTRRVPLARSLTVAAQLLAGLLSLTFVFAREQALLWVLPGPEAFERFAALLTAGAEDVGRYAIPAPATDGIRLLLVGGVMIVGLVVDTMAVTFRGAAPAGLPLLALYSVAAGLSGGGSGWLWFLLAAAGYLLLLLAEGRDRLAQWGRVFGGPPAGERRGGALWSGGAPAPVRTGRRIGAVALGIAVAVPAALPSFGGGLLGGVSGSGGGDGGGTISAVNPLVSLQDNLNQPQDREVLRYRTNAEDTSGLYLRLVALDQFDGSSWKTARRALEDVPGRLPAPQGLGGRTPATEITTNVSAAGNYEQTWLPLPYPATGVDIGGRWRFEPAGRMLVGDREQNTRGAQYSVTSLMVRPTAEQLVKAPAPPEALRREYTQVPDELPADVKSTALTVTRGAANDYERAVKLQDWFTTDGGFRYDTQVSSGTGAEAISRFLKQKEGFCVHFSFTMAAMARTLGIPARVAVGFTPGAPQSNGTMSVGIRDAHAWPELYFEGAGWTRFEPTPTVGTAPEYTRPEAPSGRTDQPAAPSAKPSAVPSAAPSVRETCPAQERRLGQCGSAAPQVAAPPSDPGTPLTTVLPVALGAVAVVLLPLLPLLWRTRVRARRLGSGGRTRTPEDATARTLAGWQEATDTAWDHGILPDDSLTPRRTAERIVRLGGLAGPPAEAMHRIAGAVEQVLYAPHPRPGTGLADDLALVRSGLRSAAGRAARLRALLAPRSAVRVAWAVAERRAAAAERRAALRRRAEARLAALLRRPSRQRG